MNRQRTQRRSGSGFSVLEALIIFAIVGLVAAIGIPAYASQAQKSVLQQKIESGKRILLAEIAPPKGPDIKELKDLAKKFSGKALALGISDNRDRVSMSALAAAASFVAPAR